MRITLLSSIAATMLLFLLTIFSIPGGNALKCFVCNSAFDQNCDAKNPPSSKFLVECSDLTAQPLSIVYWNISEQEGTIMNATDAYPAMGQEFTSCRKQDVVIPNQDNGGDHFKPETNRIVRSCGWRDTPKKDKCKVISREGIYHTTCSCLQDACNHGITNLSKSSSLFILLTIVLFQYNYRC